MNSFMRRKNPTNADNAAPIEHGDGTVYCHCQKLNKNGFGPMASKVPRFTSTTAEPNVIRAKIKRHKVTVETVKQSAKPFGRSGKVYEMGSITPGLGYKIYIIFSSKHECYTKIYSIFFRPGRYTSARKRKIIVSESFGGRRRLIPAVVTVCMPTFLDVCYVCRQQPHGIFWKNFRVGKTMCRYCKIIVQNKQLAEKSKDMNKYFELMEFQVRFFFLHN